jgi:lipid-binding SYLF domain-containing protein
MATHPRRNRFLAYTLAMSIVGGAFVGLSAVEAKESVQQQRREITTMADKTLAQLYQKVPAAKGAVNSAAGYGVFSNFGMKILILGTGHGHGVVVDKSTKKQTFMSMVQLGGGLGLGAKKFKLVFVFENADAINSFINAGWEFGGTAEAAAKWGEKGGAYESAVSVMPGVWVYQLTDKGVAADVMLKGTKYYKDDDLN